MRKMEPTNPYAADVSRAASAGSSRMGSDNTNDTDDNPYSNAIVTAHKAASGRMGS